MTHQELDQEHMRSAMKRAAQRQTLNTFPVTACRNCSSTDIFEYTSFDGQMIHCKTCGKSFDPLTKPSPAKRGRKPNKENQK